MLTKMTEETWSLVVDIFRQVCPRRGQKGADDCRFLKALHYFTVHNITWRALPETFGNWNTIWKRFSRLSRNGTFETFFRALAGCSRTAGVIQMFDSTTARAHVSAAGAKKGPSGTWPLSRRVWHEDPREVRSRWPATRFPPDRRRGLRQPAIRNSARNWTPRRGRCSATRGMTPRTTAMSPEKRDACR